MGGAGAFFKSCFMVKYIDEKQCGGPPILQATFDLNLKPSMKVYVVCDETPRCARGPE